MWISKRRFRELEKRIADLENAVQGQQRQMATYPCRQLLSPESLLKQDAQSAQKDFGSLVFQANLGNRRLFERTIEPK